MNINIGHLSIAETVMLTGVIVVILGLLVWFAKGLVQVTFSRWLDVSLPSSAPAGQCIAIFGALVLTAGILAFAWPARSAGSLPGAASSPTTAATPATTSSASSSVVSPTFAAASRASVRITTPDGATALGRDVVAAGSVGSRRFACYSAGWYVQTASDWTGYFLATPVQPRADGSFRTQVLQMGSPGETGSSWFPFLLGAPPAGCAWLRQLWAQTPTGEYHGTWPPPGDTILYTSPAAIYRTF